MKSILVGSVISSQVLLETMIEIEFPVTLVFSLDGKYSTNVSGYYPIHEAAQKNGIQYVKFKNMNDKANIDIMKKLNLTTFLL